jgi:signal peptidase I
MTRRVAFEIGALVVAAAAALAIKLWIAGIYLIPSASMLPDLMPGDYLLVDKRPFAIAHRLPRRGEIVILRHDGETLAKRVAGLPGDTVAISEGRFVLNGVLVPRWRVADFLRRPGPAMPCRVPEPQPDGPPLCRAIRQREMPPGAAPYDLLDLGGGDGEDFGPVTIPAGRLFLLGDNRPRSRDSRSAMGMVPITDLIGRTGPVIFSVDGSASLSSPRSWWASVRWGRIGRRS